MPARESRIPVSSSTTRMLCMLDGGRGRRSFGDNRKFYDEPRTDGVVLLYADGAMVIFHDAADDGQAESGAALLGREIRQEKFFFEFAAYAMAGVGHGDLHRVAAAD